MAKRWDIGQNELKQFIKDNLTIYLEMAKRAFADGELFDEMAEKLDLGDPEMEELRNRLETHLRRLT